MFLVYQIGRGLLKNLVDTIFFFVDKKKKIRMQNTGKESSIEWKNKFIK